MPRPPRLGEGENRKRINVMLAPRILKGADIVAEMCDVSRSEVLECGLIHLFVKFLDVFKESLKEGAS